MEKLWKKLGDENFRFIGIPSLKSADLSFLCLANSELQILLRLRPNQGSLHLEKTESSDSGRTDAREFVGVQHPNLA